MVHLEAKPSVKYFKNTYTKFQQFRLVWYRYPQPGELDSEILNICP